MKRQPSVLTLLYGVTFMTLLTSSVHAQLIPFPWAGKQREFEDVELVRMKKNETIGGADVYNQPGSTKEKDLKGKMNLLGYHSDVANETKDSEDIIDLTERNYDMKLAVLADDVAIIKVKQMLSGGKFGVTNTLKVSGGALWKPDSYKESGFTITRGSKYRIELHYENKHHWTDGSQADVDGISVFCYKAPELALMTYDTNTNAQWQSDRNITKANEGDVYLKAQDANPKTGESIKLRLRLREKFKDINGVADRFGKLTLRAYGKDGWNYPATSKSIRSIEIDLHNSPDAILTGNQNDELWISLPYEKLYENLVNDKDQVESDVWENFSSDEVADDGGSVDDSDLFDEKMTKVAQWRGSLRKPYENKMLPKLPITDRLVKAAGTVYLQAAFETQKINSINNALLQNQADIIYASSHCDLTHCTAGALNALPPSTLGYYWDQDTDVIIIAACHNLRIADLDRIDYIFNPLATPVTGGLEWLKNMTKAKVLLGYRFKAPRDIVNYNGKDYSFAKDIIRSFLSKTNGGRGEPDALAKAWLEANKESAKTADVGRIAPTVQDIDTGKEQRPFNACAIDVKTRNYYYWHHDTWRSKDKREPIIKTIPIP